MLTLKKWTNPHNNEVRIYINDYKGEIFGQSSKAYIFCTNNELNSWGLKAQYGYYPDSGNDFAFEGQILDELKNNEIDFTLTWSDLLAHELVK